MGNDIETDKFLNNRLDDLEIDLMLISNMDDTQIAFNLLLFTSSYCKSIYFIRTIHPVLIDKFESRFD